MRLGSQLRRGCKPRPAVWFVAIITPEALSPTRRKRCQALLHSWTNLRGPGCVWSSGIQGGDMKTLMAAAGVMVFGMALHASEPQLAGSAGPEYRSADGSISMRLPDGWRGSETTAGGIPIQVLQPAAGGDER